MAQVIHAETPRGPGRRPRRKTMPSDYERVRRDLTMGEHAEAWTEENGRRVPRRGTKAWQKMYKDWHDHAFEHFPNRAPGDE